MLSLVTNVSLNNNNYFMLFHSAQRHCVKINALDHCYHYSLLSLSFYVGNYFEMLVLLLKQISNVHETFKGT